MTRLVVGADVGGTSTRVAVADLNGTVLGVAQEPGGNPNAVGVLESAARIRTAMERALGRTPDPSGGFRVAAIVIGMAGYSTAIAAGAEFARTSVAEAVGAVPRIVSDLAVAYASGSVDPHGYVVIAGTGSGAAEIDRGEIVARRGGWGWLLGDEGAGFWLGREAVRQALFEAERGPVHSALGGLVVERLGVDPARPLEGLLRMPYQQPPVAIAQLAPLVSDLADADPAAAAIAARAAQTLAGLVLDLDPRPGRPIVITGSVLLAADPIRGAFIEQIENATGSPVARATSGLVGALWLALADLGQTPDPAVHGRLSRTLAAAFDDVTNPG
jgi:N-acetylglucosamine kinase-like BadF-type ATPase